MTSEPQTPDPLDTSISASAPSKAADASPSAKPNSSRSFGESSDLPIWLQPPDAFSHPKRLAILGATGSIGQSTLNVVRHANGVLGDGSDDGTGDGSTAQPSRGRFQVVGISGHSQVAQLAADADEFACQQVVCTCPQNASNWNTVGQNFRGQFHSSADSLPLLAASDEIDVVVAAIVGSAGLPSTLAALQAGKIVALANKETMVVAGHLATSLATRSGARLLPVDSEHSAIFQAMIGSKPSSIRRVILTASGGPFRTLPRDQLSNVTPEQALVHPTWNMGSKISIDSATMMNKALEVIEAKWLFDLPADKIQVVVHPQSIVHSFVEFTDGSVLAQLSPPDMQLPIQFALDYPARFTGPASRMDFSSVFQLDFQPPDMDRFPALLLGLEVARRGGTTGAVLNAANEVAVEAFLNRKIRFTQITQICRDILDHHHFDANPTLQQLLLLDQWARQETWKWISN